MKTPVDHSFGAFNFNTHIQNCIAAAGFTTPTPIQKQSIPAILAGNDVMGLAQTGTGKTAAFVLPILQRLAGGSRGRVRALILAPTRELAQQIHDAITMLSKGLNLRSVPLYGGVSIQPQIKKLRQADIVVACPGRLLDHHARRTVNLSQVETLVLDEADHMFDIGFLPNVRKILQQLPKTKQALLFSATMPKEVRELANEVLKNPVTIKIGDSAPTKSVTQAIFPVSPGLKDELLLKILQTIDAHSVLVFTRTKQRAQQIADFLEEWGYSATSLQGNLSQSKRQRALDDFRSGKLQILVATDIASRGIDVAQISHVINYDIPSTIEAYTHRIGRTGRATKLGDAFTLVTRAEMGKVRAIERSIGQAIEQRSIPDFDYQAKGTTEADRDPRQRTPKKNFSPHNDKPGKTGGKDRPGQYKKKNFTGETRTNRGERKEAFATKPKKKFFEKSGDSEFKSYAPKRKFSGENTDRPFNSAIKPGAYKKKSFANAAGEEFKPYTPKKKFATDRADRSFNSPGKPAAYKKKVFGKTEGEEFKPYPSKKKFTTTRSDRPFNTPGKPSSLKKKTFGKPFDNDRETAENASYNPLKKRTSANPHFRSGTAGAKNVKKNHGDFQHDKSRARNKKPRTATGGPKTFVKKRRPASRKPANY